MAFDPQPGLVVRYDFLWKEEEKAGQVDGRKDRPCLILAVKKSSQSDQEREVLLCPITHTPSIAAEKAVEVPVAMARHLQLDDDRMWIKTDQLNTVVWPKKQIPLGLVRVREGEYSYGKMHSKLSAQAMDNVREHLRERTLKNVRRDVDPAVQAFKDRMKENRDRAVKDQDRER